MTAPGDNISSTCDSTGTVVGPCPPGHEHDGVGHEHGLAARRRRRRGAAAGQPQAHAGQVRLALQVTATPVTERSRPGRSAFWQAGYGHVDLAAAVEARARPRTSPRPSRRSRRRPTRRVLGASGFTVQRSDLWMWDAPQLTLQAARRPDVPVASRPRRQALKDRARLPVIGAALRVNGFDYIATVKRRRRHGRRHDDRANCWHRHVSLFVDLRTVERPRLRQAWTVEVTGDARRLRPRHLDSDSATGRKVTLLVAQLRA